MVVGVLAAYAVTRLRFRGRRLMGNVTIVTYLIPPALLFIPLFQVAAQFNLTNSTLGLILIYLIFSVPFCTWLSIAHLQAIPIELEEASLVDGCTRLQSLWLIVVPLLLPALAVIALYAFTQAWNEFLYALILISTGSRKTLPVGLADFVVGDVYNWPPDGRLGHCLPGARPHLHRGATLDRFRSHCRSDQGMKHDSEPPSSRHARRDDRKGAFCA